MADPSSEMLRHGSLRRSRRFPLQLAGRVLPVVSPARVYVCGITPYDVTHLGHAATFVWADATVRTLRAAGVEVVGGSWAFGASTWRRTVAIARGCTLVAEATSWGGDEYCEPRLVTVPELRAVAREGRSSDVDLVYLALDAAGLLWAVRCAVLDRADQVRDLDRPVRGR